jgi:hypothetical protein
MRMHDSGEENHLTILSSFEERYGVYGRPIRAGFLCEVSPWRFRLSCLLLLVCICIRCSRRQLLFSSSPIFFFLLSACVCVCVCLMSERLYSWYATIHPPTSSPIHTTTDCRNKPNKLLQTCISKKKKQRLLSRVFSSVHHPQKKNHRFCCSLL